MNMRMAILFVTFATVALFAQTGRREAADRTPADRIAQWQRRFPPEVIVPSAATGRAPLSRSYCVQPALDTNTFSVKPCRTDSRKPGVLAPFNPRRRPN
jgi:hypothetical protein